MPGGKIDILINPDFTGFEARLTQGLNTSGSTASKLAKGIGVAIATGVGVAAVGLKQVVDLGIQFQDNLNQLQAVSGATASQMQQVSARATALGNDLSLPATSAADAAQAMLELAKGGLSVDQAMTAAKGTLQLAAAAQISGAQAAEVQANAINAFGLSASDAGHVADVLANTANAASGEITDFAQALEQSGAVSHQFGISLDDTATALGLFANSGIKGSDAGTLLKQALLQLANPSKPAAAAIQELGLKVYDAQGKFVGLESIMAQLHTASTKLTQQQYSQATATLFGSDAVRFAGVAAQDTTADWDKMAAAVGKSGGAADVAGAQMKGLGGALQGLQSNLETEELKIFGVIEPSLEAGARAATGLVSQIGDKTVAALQGAVVVAQTFGPGIVAALESKGATIAAAVREDLQPLVTGVESAILQSIGIVTTYVSDIGSAARTVVDDVQPVAKAIGAVVESASRAGAPLSAAGAALRIIGDATKDAVKVVGPLASIVAGLVHDFADLPGPVQTAVTALIALKAGGPILSGLKSAFGGASSAAEDGSGKTGLFGKAVSGLTAPVRIAASGITTAANTVRQFSGEMQVQRALAEQSGASVGKLGASMGALNSSTISALVALRNFREQTSAIQAGAAAAGQPISSFSAALGTLVERSPALSAMRSSFQDASDGAERFGKLAGTAAAAGTGLKLAAGGLLGALGGPFGLVLTAASLGLGLLAQHQEDAAKAAAAQKQAVDDLAGTLDKTTGAVTADTRAQQAQANAQNGVADAAGRQHVALNDLLDAQTGNQTKLNAVNGQLRDQASAWLENSLHISTYQDALNTAGLTADDFTQAALGNQAAIAKINSALGGIPDTADETFSSLSLLWSQVQDGDHDFTSLGASIASANANLTEAQKQVRDTAAALGTTTTNAGQLTSDMDTLGNSTSSVSDKVSALKDALDRLNGGQISLANSQAAVNKSFTDINDTIAAGIDHANGWGAALLNADGSLNTMTKNGQAVQSFASGLSSSLSDLAQQTLQVSQNAGDDLPTSFHKVEDAAAKVRAQFIATATQFGLNTDQANKLADAYGLVPSEVATLVTTNGSAPEVQREVQGVIDKVNATPPGHTTTMTALTADAQAALASLGYNVTHLPNGQFEVVANTVVAGQQLDRFVANNNGRQITVFVNTATGSGHVAGSPTTFKASGGIVEAWADGGLRPMRGGYASVVGPNTWRVIGDRVVDDEAYIPINRSSRSHGILAETAARMGYALLRQYAAGGVATATQPAAIAPVGGPTITNNVTVSANDDAYLVAQTIAAKTAWQMRTRR